MEKCRERSSGTRRVNTSPYLDPSPESPFQAALTPYPLRPAVLIGMEGQGSPLGWGEPAEGLQVEAVGGEPNGGSQAVA